MLDMCYNTFKFWFNNFILLRYVFLQEVGMFLCHLGFWSTSKVNKIENHLLIKAIIFNCWFWKTSSQIDSKVSCHMHTWCQPNISSCRPLLLLPSIFPSIRVFSNESVLQIRWAKYWSFSFSISLSNKYAWLISFRMDWMDHHAIQETLKCILQYHSLKASILEHSAFFIVQLSHPYMPTEKTIIALKR